MLKVNTIIEKSLQCIAIKVKAAVMQYHSRFHSVLKHYAI